MAAVNHGGGCHAGGVAIDERAVRTVAIANAGARVAIGLAFLAAPKAFGGRWFGDEATRPIATLVTRMVAARDLVLGVGMLRALARGEPVRPWFALAVGVDAVDGLAALAAREHLPKWTVIASVLSAGSGVVSDALIASHTSRSSADSVAP
jgi:hypothetical protein